VDDTLNPDTPDSVFPNNWISFHENGDALYPMFAVNRRSERRGNFGYVRGKGFKTENIVDYTAEKMVFLEGTGSFLDRAMKKSMRFVSSC
jgi:hypothetical protein